MGKHPSNLLTNLCRETRRKWNRAKKEIDRQRAREREREIKLFRDTFSVHSIDLRDNAYILLSASLSVYPFLSFLRRTLSDKRTLFRYIRIWLPWTLNLPPRSNTDNKSFPTFYIRKERRALSERNLTRV